jgi:hypothetical protein
MLRYYVLNDGMKWDKYLPLAELSYNNSYQESIKMSPFEALYGWPCYMPLSWSESGERIIFGPDIMTKVEEKVKQIRANILTAQSLQKSYTDIVTPSFKAKTECIPLCVPGSIFTHKVINSEINSITSVYYNVS